MSLSPADVHNAIQAKMPQAQQFLADLISTPSLSGEEQAAMEVAADYFAQVAEVERVPTSNALRDDPDYSDPIPDIDYTDRFNLRIVQPGSGTGQRLLLNTHVDVVPPSQGQVDPYDPRVDDQNHMWGRGSCDAKGQVVTAWLAMAALKEAGATLGGDLIAHIVVEEENGGNGTLAMVRHGEQADGCVVLEPTEHHILTSIRGAVWFQFTIKGKPGHSGAAGKTQSALLRAVRVMEIVTDYHAKLLAASRGDPLFDKYENPMPLTFGKLHAGNWPATAPGEAVLEGLTGILPNKTAKQVMEEINTAVREQGGPDIADNFNAHYTYRHDSSVVATDHPLVLAMQQAAEATKLTAPIDAMPASCDAWFYNNQIDIPTLVFGGGTITVAHSNQENMPLDELASAAEALANLSAQWCSTEK